VFFESPRRVGVTLAELAAAFGPDRRAAVCRELTKTHEEVLRGTLGELADLTRDGALGEITLVVAGAPQSAGPVATEDAVAAVTARVRGGLSRKDAIAEVAAELGLRRRELYAAVVAGDAADQHPPDKD
jgi:16S rRNA (cytidine1402-2'-O)-methyltransferase